VRWSAHSAAAVCCKRRLAPRDLQATAAGSCAGHRASTASYAPCAPRFPKIPCADKEERRERQEAKTETSNENYTLKMQRIKIRDY
jgi:hypothetical protein